MEAELGVEGAIAEEAALLAQADGLRDAADGEWILGADVEDRLGGADRVGGYGESLEDAEGVGLEQHPVHESARVALVAVADDVLRLPRRGTRQLPLGAGREPRASAPAEAGVCHRVDDRLGLELCDTLPEGSEAVVGDVVVDVHRPHGAVELRGDVLLRTQESAQRPVAHVDRVPRNGLPRLVGQEVVQSPTGGGLHLAHKAARLEVLPDHRLGIAGFHSGIDNGLLPRHRDLDQRSLAAHAHAPHRPHHRRSVDVTDRILEGGADVHAPARDAARAHADSDLCQPLRYRGDVQALATSPRAALKPQEVLEHLLDTRGGDVSVGNAVYLDHRRQCATPQTVDPAQ